MTLSEPNARAGH